MQARPSLKMLPLGLLELDSNGTVLYFKADRESDSVCAKTNVVGLNLFTDIVPIAEALEFQERIKAFRRRHAPAESFHFTFNFNHSQISVKVLLAHIHEQSVLGSTDSVLVHIRLRTQRMAA